MHHQENQQTTHKPARYITTSIPYVNARPHIGIALEFVQADALARFYRLQGYDVRLQSGTDENSLKNVRAAEQEGISTRALVDRNAAQFAALRDTLNLSFDNFIRTSADERHAEGVRKLWEACAQRGDIYRRTYRGLYCVGCEQFYTEDELINGVCPDHLVAPEVVEEENYFFRLSRYAPDLERLIAAGELRITPQSRKNEILSFIRRGLEDFSISRSQARARGWGIPVPGDAEQVTYVWFDALGNYITALGYAEAGAAYERYWLNGSRRSHVIGKNITRFHAIYWPAILLSAGEPLPHEILVHGFVTLEGRKVSKSLGNSVDPVALAESYGVDALRYYLLREIPTTEDGDFSLERFERIYNADLADQLGNLLNRTVSLIQRYYDGIVPAPGPVEEADQALLRAAGDACARVDAAVTRFALHEALAAILSLVSTANKYVVTVEPWKLAKQRQTAGLAAEGRLVTALYNLAEALRLVAHLLFPFLPNTAQAITQQLGVALATDNWTQALRWGEYPAGAAVRQGGVLFPKMTRRRR
jgi:methionyl-tRNA synthetase